MQLPGPGVFGPPRDRDLALAVRPSRRRIGRDPHRHRAVLRPGRGQRSDSRGTPPVPADLVLVSKVGATRDETGEWLPAQRPEELRVGIEANLAVVGSRSDPRRQPASAPRLRRAVRRAARRHDRPPRRRDDRRGIGLSNVTLDEYRPGASTHRPSPASRTRTASRTVQIRLSSTPAGDGVPYVPFFPLGSAFIPTTRCSAPSRAGAASASVHPGPGGVGLAATPDAERVCSSRGRRRSATWTRTSPRPKSSSTRAPCRRSVAVFSEPERTKAVVRSCRTLEPDCLAFEKVPGGSMWSAPTEDRRQSEGDTGREHDLNRIERAADLVAYDRPTDPPTSQPSAVLPVGRTLLGERPGPSLASSLENTSPEISDSIL